MKKTLTHLPLLLISVIAVSCATDSGPTLYTISTSVQPSEAGTIEPSLTEIEEGETITFRAIPNNGWEFTEWTGDVTSVNNPTTVTVDNDLSLTANFFDVRSNYTVDMVISNSQDDINLSFGQLEESEELSQQVPPSPPDGSFHAYFQKSGITLWKDYRENFEKEVNWQLVVKPSGNSDVIISWSTSGENLRGTLAMRNSNTEEEIDMLQQQQVSISSENTLSITYTFQEEQ